jgi:MoxR-like ATPase
MAIKRTPLTNSCLSKPFTFDLAGVSFERSPLTQKILDGLGLNNQARSHSFGEDWHEDVLENVFIGDHPVCITGVSGSGKDYTAEALAWALGRPLVKLSIKPDLDPNEWVGGTSLRGDGVGGTETVAENGWLARACAGWSDETWEKIGAKRIAPVVLISDFDRATPRQLEVFRQAFEERSRRYLSHPTTGCEIPIHPDTIFILTSNSGIDGDGGSGNVTSQLDTSIVNRIMGVMASAPSAKFERDVLSRTFPQLDKAEVALLVKCLRSLRSAMKECHLPFEVSLRTGNMVAKKALLAKRRGKTWEEALRRGFKVVSGHCHEPDNRALIKGALDPIIGSPSIGSTKL